jgi:hypothetical protein
MGSVVAVGPPEPPRPPDSRADRIAAALWRAKKKTPDDLDEGREGDGTDVEPLSPWD